MFLPRSLSLSGLFCFGFGKRVGDESPARGPPGSLSHLIMACETLILRPCYRNVLVEESKQQHYPKLTRTVFETHKSNNCIKKQLLHTSTSEFLREVSGFRITLDFHQRIKPSRAQAIASALSPPKWQFQICTSLVKSGGLVICIHSASAMLCRRKLAVWNGRGSDQ